jgi:hypothetical protein
MYESGKRRTNNCIPWRESMPEYYEIISHARGEPRPAGSVGVRVYVRLSGCPSRGWSQALGAHLATELTGHAAVGHLRININEIVQGDQIVLEGVEPIEAPALAQHLQRAIDATNQAATTHPHQAANATQQEAQAIAGQIDANDPRTRSIPSSVS